MVPRARILVADDDRATREMLQLLLQDEGYEVLFARNGAEVVEIASQQPLDLVLLDLMMPEVDGYEALNTLRESGKLESLPILILSARSIPIYQEISRNLGALQHIVKPFLPDELLAAIRSALHQKRVGQSACNNLSAGTHATGGPEKPPSASS